VRITSGRPNASVLPEPVFALPQTSRPARASGIVSACTGDGTVMPARASTSTRSRETPRSSNVGALSVAADWVDVASRGDVCSALPSEEAARVRVKIDKRTGLRFLRRAQVCASHGPPSDPLPPSVWLRVVNRTIIGARAPSAVALPGSHGTGCERREESEGRSELRLRQRNFVPAFTVTRRRHPGDADSPHCLRVLPPLARCRWPG
jgi:hypothetical protein